MPTLQGDGCKLPGLYRLSYKRKQLLLAGWFGKKLFLTLEAGPAHWERKKTPHSYRNPESHGASCCQLLLLEMAVLNPLQEYVCPLRKVHLWYPSKLPFVLCPFLFLEKMKGGKGVYQQILKKKKKCAQDHLRILCEISRCKSLLKTRHVGTFDLLLQSCSALHLDKHLCLELERERNHKQLKIIGCLHRWGKFGQNTKRPKSPTATPEDLGANSGYWAYALHTHHQRDGQTT